MKIIYYSPHPHLNLSSPSGYGTHMREMIHAFEQLGHEVFPVIAGGTVLTPSHGSIPAPSTIKKMIKKLIPAIIWESLKDQRLMKHDAKMKQVLRSAIAKQQPDFVYERLNYLQLSGVEVCNEKQIPHFYEINAPYAQEKLELEGNSFYRKKALKIEREQLTRTSKAFTITQALGKYFVETHHLKSSDIEVIPNAIDPDKFIVDPKEVKALRTNLGLNTEDPVVGFVGSILKWHGVDLMIEAFNNASQGFPKAKLLVVGSGESMDELQALTADLGIKEKVIFTGNVPHQAVAGYISLMDITVMAKTNWYGSPIKIFEYGALNKAIIAPDRSTVHDVMEPNVDGILVDANIPSIQNAMERFLGDATQRKNMAQHFHDKVLQNYTWKSNANRVLNAFEQVKHQ